MDLRGYADFVPLGASVTPLRGSDSFTWTVKFRNGMTKRFKFPICTTEEGLAVPGGDYPVTTVIDSIELFTELAAMKMPIWTFKK